MGGIDLNLNLCNAHEDQNFNYGLNFDLNTISNHEIDLNLPAIEEEDDFNSNNQISAGEQFIEPRQLKVLSNPERQAVFNMLLQKSLDGRLKRGVTRAVALEFSICIRTVQRIWKKGKEDNDNVCHRKTKNCGRKRITTTLNTNQILDIPLRNRTTIRSLASAINLGKSTVHRMLKWGSIRRHSNPLKPTLTEENKRARLRFCLYMLEDYSIPQAPFFKPMYNVIHIDEKFFFMTKKVEKYYLLQGESDPTRHCKNKNFIGKIMFLAALARPCFDAEQNVTFSGKIGIFPFVTSVPARRSSVNRVVGTLETKPIESINRDVVRSFLIEKLLPAIKEKWPRDELRYPIIIQQDNARPHIAQNDVEFNRAARELGLDVHLVCQPPNSPDLNVLDLGFFAAIQSLQYKENCRTFDELISAVQSSYESFEAVKSNRIFLSLQLSMLEIMKSKGSNEHKIPHLHKEKLEREGRLPTTLECDATLFQEVLQHLN